MTLPQAVAALLAAWQQLPTTERPPTLRKAVTGLRKAQAAYLASKTGPRPNQVARVSSQRGEIARLLNEGLTQVQIAQQLTVSVGLVAKVRRELGLSTPRVKPPTGGNP